MIDFAMLGRARSVCGLILAGALLAGCTGGSGDTADTQSAAVSPNSPAAPTTPTSPTTPAAPTNKAPTIAGSAPLTVVAGTAYSFTPTANDADGNALTFSIVGKPSWASFSTSTGALTGTPAQSDVGAKYVITISVSDGQATTPLSAFTLSVVGTATGSATLSWTPPSTNSDGTTLADLVGYRVYWGTTQGQYTSSASLNNPGLSRYVIDQLTPAKWYFVVTSINSSGTESQYSNVASKVVM